MDQPVIYDDHIYCAAGHCGECWCYEVWSSDSGEPCGIDHSEEE
jgi:hypothetical protein